MSSHKSSFATRCDKSRPLFAGYNAGNAPTNSIDFQRWSMAGGHLMILEILENIYNLADTIPPEEEQNFTLFCLFGTQIIEHHHHLEETVIFPMMEPQFTTDVLAEHSTFTGALHELETYLKSVVAVKQGEKNGQFIPIPGQPKQPYDAVIVKRCLDTLVEPLFTHLEHELAWLAPENIRASGLTEERMKEIDVKAEEHIMRDMDTSLLVFGIGHTRPTMHFPPVPWALRNVLVPWVFWWKNRAVWKYLPKSLVPV